MKNKVSHKMKAIIDNKILLLILMMILFSSNSLSAASKDPQEHFFDSSFGDFSEELVSAKEQGKKGIMIFFEMDDCPFCHWMKKNVLNKP
ncbi:MAG: hypothetical protein IME94_04885, partial [Proteobacteria bacterium]|nr:hypothetical protein [Pseudomonadota bacterium]